MSVLLEKMSKEKETDAANVLSQMSQLVGSVSFDISGNLSTSLSSAVHDDFLEAESIGATCTLQPSNLDLPLFGLGDVNSFPGGRPGDADPCIAFDDSEHTYAAHSFDSSGAVGLLTEECLPTMWQEREEMLPRIFGILPVTCKFCAKTFKRAYNLKIHMRSHSGERPHPCSFCGFTFRTASDLKRHVRMHVTDKEDLAKFHCEECNRVFIDQASLKRHARTHSTTADSYTCEKCAKVFRRLDCFKIHVRSHSPDNSFRCPHCPREFQYKSSFNRHLNNHSSSKAFVCATCGKGFNRPDTLHVHAKLHSADRPSKRAHKSEMFLSAAADVLDSTPLLDCSVDISCEHRYSMETKKRTARRKKGSESSKRCSASRKKLEMDIGAMDMPDLDSFQVGGKSDDSVGDVPLEPFDGLGARELLPVKRISPVPILMSMAESAAHFHGKPAQTQVRICCSSNLLSRRDNRMATRKKPTKRRGSRSAKAQTMPLFPDGDNCLPPSPSMSEAGVFVPLVPGSGSRLKFSEDMDRESCVMDCASVLFSDSDSTCSSSSDDMCISIDSDSNDDRVDGSMEERQQSV